MHDEPEVPRDPESDRRGHEVRDVAARPIVYFVIGLLLFGGTIQYLMALLMSGYVKEDTKAAVPTADYLRDHGDLTRPPALQRDTTADMRRMYAEEDAFLNTEPTVDKKTGKIRIKIDRAIEIVARKGLPHRETPPKSSTDPEFSYSERAKAYKVSN